MERVQKQIILRDLEKKIVLLVGPRQSGKTWLAREIAKHFPKSVYLNYDQPTDRRILHEQSWLNTTDLLILDELHKMPDWKNYLKGVYDTKPQTMRLLVTGSARLDIFDHAGDSLAGRYFRHRLNPISLAELHKTQEPGDLNRLMERGGFPEPFFAADEVDATRWRSQYLSSMLSTDVFDVDTIQNIKALNLVVNLLRYRVGSPLSYQSVAQDVGVSPTTVKKYIQILEALFIIFSVTPYHKNIARSLIKEPKIYFYDTGLVQGDDGARFENTIAVSLLKHTCGLSDATGQDHRLHYLRTKEGHEVDFALVKDDLVEQVIEAKLTDATISKSLTYFKKKYGYNACQVVKNVRTSFQSKECIVYNAESFLKDLFL